MEGPAAADRVLAIDFMDMSDDRRLWTRAVDARLGFDPAVGRHVIVGDDDADARVARASPNSVGRRRQSLDVGEKIKGS